ncbi:MAG: hypothetical protein QE285_07780 [Aquabacterium sp.]|nr:hypothetical protein [Aquabacterium sp.]
MYKRGAVLGCQVLFSAGARAKGAGDIGFWTGFPGRHQAAGLRITTITHMRPMGTGRTPDDDLDRQRGVGWHADLNGSDGPALGCGHPEYVHD